MAERRMFSKSICDSDAFLDMPQSTQLLYFHLGLRADDDGFVNNPKSIMRNVSCKDDDMKLLIAKGYIIGFRSGVVVIRHWRIHNCIQKDRYHETKYKMEKAELQFDENKSYVYRLETQASQGKPRKELVEGKRAYGKNDNVLLTTEEYSLLDSPLGREAIEKMSDYLAERKVEYQSHYLAIKVLFLKD